MTKLKRIALCLAFMLLLFSVIFYGKEQMAYATTHKVNNLSEDEQNNDIEPRLLTSLSISLNGGNGKVWATVKNDFTLFPSTVVVIVQLYYSYTYCESYTEMILESENSTKDLDMGDTIVAEASTGGEQKYWMGRMRYKIGSKSWEERTVGVLKYNANGDYIDVL